ncbi:MAG: hypothetical protein WC812_01450 [Candidatus Pacearchaeota archaeon]|jgi:flagellar biogenesis protein FliO
MVNSFYGCFNEYGMMSGNYLFSWLFGILGIIALILFIIWITKKIQNENKNGGKK